jgi:anthranilate synthase/aminodeoxychorismate synthase-like glutamine amidotransferase
MLILIDNYDSFTYNLVQYFGDLNQEITVFRNDQISVNEIIDKKPSAIIISPGPSNPDNAGICIDLVMEAEKLDIPILGVCLGHQVIGQVFGGKIIKAPSPIHGKTDSITHDKKDIYRDLPSPFSVTRYHSLIIDKNTLPEELEITLPVMMKEL